MLIDNVNEFAIWLVNELTGLSDADPEALSKYVIALLKKDKSESSLRKICVDQLNVFLAEKTKKFIDNVFDCLKHKRFKKSDSEKEIIESDMTIKFSDKNKNQNKTILTDEDLLRNCYKFSPNSKLKLYDDNHRSLDNRSYSKRSRGSSYKLSEDSHKKKRFNEDIDLKDRRYHSSKHKSHKSKKHVFDRIDYPQKYLEGNDDPKLIDYSTEKKIWDIKTSCPDFVEKGVCMKGDSCEFDHGLDIVKSDINCIYSGARIPPDTVNSRWQQMSTWVDKFTINKPIQNMLPRNVIDSHSYHANIKLDSNNNKNINDIYDPSHPEIDLPGECDNKKIKIANDSDPVYVPSQVERIQKETWNYDDDDDDEEHGNGERDVRNDDNVQATGFEEGSKLTTIIGSGQNRTRYQRVLSPRRGRFVNSSDNRFNRRQGVARCLLLTHIPMELNDEKKLFTHFSGFGKVNDVKVAFQGDPHHALVEFASSENARLAFRSPLPIFDNRFIRTSLFVRPNESSNLTLCKDTSDDEDSRKKRKVVQCNGSRVHETDYLDNNIDELKFDKKHIYQRINSETDHVARDIVKTEQPQQRDRFEKPREPKWPLASDLKLDRRPATNIDSNNRPSMVKRQKNDITKFRLSEDKKEADVKVQLLNDREEMKNRIDRLHESVQSCKNRLRMLIEEQRKPDCDQELTKRQLFESYNYFKELREMLDSIRKKYETLPDLSEEEKLKLKIKTIQNKLKETDEKDDEYNRQLKQVTELKRQLVKLQGTAKKVPRRCSKLPSLVETKLDNRPRTIYVTGTGLSSATTDEVIQTFKCYQVDKIAQSENGIADGGALFYAVKFQNRKQADRAISEMGKCLLERNIILSFEKPKLLPCSNPVDFGLRSVPTETTSPTSPYRGTPSRRGDGCTTSDEEETTKLI